MRELFLDYVQRFIGSRYRYGGENPISGFDCSGLVSEGLQAMGVIHSRLSAQDLYAALKSKSVETHGRGSIVFFGSSRNHIHHTGILLSETHMIEAGSGTSQILTIEDADYANAFIRIRPLSHRRDCLVALLPNEFQ